MTGLDDAALIRRATELYERDVPRGTSLRVDRRASDVDRRTGRAIVTLRERDGRMITRYEARVTVTGLRFVLPYGILEPRRRGR